MPIVRPIVYVYQEYATLTVTPATPDLECLIVGPNYYIQDYATDKASIRVKVASVPVDFLKTGYTKDAPCANSPAGTSLGRPDPGADFLVLSEPPNISPAPGADLDAASVHLVFDEVYIEKEYGSSTTSPCLAANANWFEFTGHDFSLTTEPGDRIVLTKNASELTADTVVKTVLMVDPTNSAKLLLTDNFTSDQVTALGTTNVKFRIEHKLEDQTIDAAYYTISGNQITIRTGPTGIRVVYGTTSYPVNFAEMYIGYRALRQDKSSVITVNDTSEVASKLGRLDERNPLAVGVYVALQNANTPIKAYGVATDDLTGQTTARDHVTTRSDIYAIVPVTGALTGASWLGVIDMWKAHVEAYAQPEKSKFRVVIGSYDVLPEEKASAPASVVGYTEASTATYDVFVDPSTHAEFVTRGVGDDDLLEITHSTSLDTLPDGATIFKPSYGTPKALHGAVGEKRLRTTTAFGGAYSAHACDYAIRPAILKSEGGTYVLETADVSGTLTPSNNGSAKLRLTGSSGTFDGAQVGMLVALRDCDTAALNEGHLILAIDAVNKAYIDVDAAFGTEASTDIVATVYQPAVTKSGVTLTGSTKKLTTTGGAFLNVLVGDIAFILSGTTPANLGMWIVSAKTTDNNEVTLASASVLSDDTVNVAFYHPTTSHGNASVTTRARLDRLRDDSATFLTTVQVGENIQIPYPADTDPTKWDTAVTEWPIAEIISNQTLRPVLSDTEELAPEAFVAGYNGDMPYRVTIALDPEGQVEELLTITTTRKSSRLVMVWPNECLVSGVENERTGVQNHQHGQYLACAVGGMIAGLPSQQGFTFIGIAGIQQIFNSNFYFNDSQLDELSEGGWYLFLQDSESAAPYSAHEVTTDTDAYETGELMHVKNFDYVALFYKSIVQAFLGKYNINTETLSMLRDSFNGGTKTLQRKTLPRIGAPIINAEITDLAPTEGEVDRVELYAEVDLPHVLNRIGMHLKA